MEGVKSIGEVQHHWRSPSANQDRQPMRRRRGEPAIGIDYGFTNVCVAVAREGRAEILNNNLGYAKTPCLLAWTNVGLVAGETARNQMAMNLNGMFYCSEKHWLPRELENLQTMPRLQRHWLMLEMIIKLDIPYIRQRPMYKDAVITVPAYFTHAQKWVTVTAAECACLNVLRTISEPTAAAMAYFFANEVNLGDNLMIIGLGGFTSEVSILTIDEDTCEFHAARVHLDLGGHKFDRNMVNHFAEWFEINQGINIGRNERSLNRLRVACERAKRSLSVETVANVQVDSLVENIDFNRQITRALFQSLNSQEFRSIIDTIRQALQDAVMEKTQIDAIIMVGGSSRIPRIQSLIRDYFNGMQLHMNIDPDHVVAIGAARLAAYDRLEEFSENFDRINQHIADLS